jgi:hypothetical protein
MKTMKKIAYFLFLLTWSVNTQVDVTTKNRRVNLVHHSAKERNGCNEIGIGTT